ncbi:MAG: DUF4126 family protein [Actinomycetota bacterium]|nr:DUF4126 family protein [Actinomycetota bacterium]
MLRRRKRVEFEVTPATLKTLGLAGVAGLRSMAAPALLARAVQRRDLDAPNLPALGYKDVSKLLSFLSFGEMVADKTHLVPARTSAPALLGRLLSGAVAGSILFTDEGRRSNSGAILGALSAFTAAYTGEKLRAMGVQRGIPDPILGILEDRLAISLGTRLLRKS